MEESYEGREQSAAKHLILKSYLEKLAYKVGFFRPGTLNYIDGFAGPWESKTADLSDTSPSLALQKLIEVRAELANHGKSVDVRAFFVSPKREGAEQLRALQARFPAAAIEVVEQTFENSIDRARKFAAEGRDPFSFIFIGHTGWTGSSSGADVDSEELADVLNVLAPRWFVLRNVHEQPSMTLLQTRTTLSWLRGPMTRQDLKRALVRGSEG